jgi:hypothetical protein
MHLWALEDKMKGQSPSGNRYIIVQGEPTSLYIVCFCPVLCTFTYVYKFWHWKLELFKFF